jgi:hypothetical protein
MAAENGCLTLTAPQVANGTVIVTPAVPPTAGKAEARRTYALASGPRVKVDPRAVTVVGATLSINVAKCAAGDMLCWTSYS